MRSVITDFVLMLSSSVGLSILTKATGILLLGLVVGTLVARLRAAWRHLVFATTFAAVLVLPLVAVSIPELPIEFAVAGAADDETQRHSATAPVLTATLVEPTSASSITTSRSMPAAWSLPSVGSVLFFVWIGGAALLMFLLIVDLLRVRHMRRHGLPSARLAAMVERLTRNTRLGRVNVMLHETIGAPVTFRFLPTGDHASGGC
jgi:beta-lactamase regulating signal transducer with metallopeptidase domain